MYMHLKSNCEIRDMKPRDFSPDLIMEETIESAKEHKDKS